MIELIVINDPAPGRRFHADAAPVRLGRRADLEVVLRDAGVWENHAEIAANDDGWFLIRAVGAAHVSVNEHPIKEHRLRNGDVLGMGSVKLQFTLRNPPQRSLKGREVAAWLMIVAVVCLAVIVMFAIGI